MPKLNHYILFIFFITIYSCDNKQLPEKDKHGTRIFYDLDKYAQFQIKHPNERVIIVDTFCKSEKKRAITDIEKNNLTYFTTLGFEKKEYEQILFLYSSL